MYHLGKTVLVWIIYPPKKTKKTKFADISEIT